MEWTIEVFDDLQTWDVLTETVKRVMGAQVRLRHLDGTFIGIGWDRYPQRGHTIVNAAVWPSFEEAEAYNDHWGGTFEVVGQWT